ncbi:MAG TPA: hypothetical protein VNG32_03665 [Candidatus Dormibacteraeota bacterium]|nr:hypothetical protein [Candidatus Dormibacteraeota bacterium]
MSESNIFENKVSKLGAEQRREAEQQLENERRQAAARAASDAQKALRNRAEETKKVNRAALLENKSIRDHLHVGTDPEVILGEKGGKLCRDFIDYVSERQFKGAVMLKHTFIDQRNEERFQRSTLGQYPKDSQWSILGYGIGAIGGGNKPPASDSSDAGDWLYQRGSTSLGYNVFLCEDGKLRLYINQIAAVPDSGESASSYWHGANDDYLASPCVISDLPIDLDTGLIITPTIGRFIYTHASPARSYTEHEEPAFNTIADSDGIHITRMVAPGRHEVISIPAQPARACFEARSLEQLLTDYAFAADQPGA